MELMIVEIESFDLLLLGGAESQRDSCEGFRGSPGSQGDRRAMVVG